MRTSLVLDEELVEQVEKVVGLVKETPASVLRMAIRAGLPIVAARHQDPGKGARGLLAHLLAQEVAFPRVERHTLPSK